MARLEMEGDRFRVEGELIVFYDSAQARGRPTGAASTAGLLYVRSDNQSEATTGYEVEGRFAMDGTTSILTAAGAEAFFTELGFAVFYEDVARQGRQMLAVRCSEIESIRRMTIRP